MNATSEKPVRVDVLLSPDELVLFRRFLKDTGRKAGPYVRTKILEAIEKEYKPEAVGGRA